MPRKKEGDPQIRVHIWIYESDWLWLKSLYSDTVGPSKFVRLAVRQVIKKVMERQNAGRKPIDTSTLDAELASFEREHSGEGGSAEGSEPAS